MVRKLKKYQSYIETFLEEEAADRTSSSINWEVVTDTKHHHYQLVETGWYNKKHIYRVLFHLQIKENEKIWLLVNNTDILVAEELVKKGVASSDIVLGFQPENVRQYTGFAVI
ncbi:MAG: hypothetical protein RLZZ292_2637 [Bacteroidota bacterium]|jgi:hypothetical protein